MLGNLLLGIVSLCTLLSYLPQTIQLLKTKSSEDLSLTSWILWVVSSYSYTLYAILVSKDFMLIVQTALELIFCMLILILSIFYTYKNNK